MARVRRPESLFRMARTRRSMSSATKRPAETTTTIRLARKVFPPATDSRPSDGEADSPLKETGILQESLEQLEDLASRCGIANSSDSNARALGDQSRTDVTLQQKVEFLEEFAGIWQQYALAPTFTYSRVEDSGNATTELQNRLSQYLQDVVASKHEKAQRYFKRLTAQTWNGEKAVRNSEEAGTLAGEEDGEERHSAKSTVQAAATWTPLRLFLLVGMRAISSWRTLLGMCELAEASQQLLAWDEVFHYLLQERRLRIAGAPLGLKEAKKHGKTGFGRGINIKSEWSSKELDWAKERVTKEVQKRRQQSGVAGLGQDVATGEEDGDEQSSFFESVVFSVEALQASQARREALKEMRPRVRRRAKPKARLPSPNPRDGLGSGSSPEHSPEIPRGATRGAPASYSPSSLQPRLSFRGYNSSRDSSPSGDAVAVPSPQLFIDNNTQAYTAGKDESFRRSPEYQDEDQNDDAGIQLDPPESESASPLTTPTRLSDMLQGFTSSSASRKRGISATREDMLNKRIKEAVPSGNAAEVRAIMTSFNNAAWVRNEEDLNLWMKVWTANVPDGLRHLNVQLGDAVLDGLDTGERCCVLVTQEQARASPVAVAYIEPGSTDDMNVAGIFVPRHEGEIQSESRSLIKACLSVLNQLTSIHTGLDQHGLEEAAQDGLREGFLNADALTVDIMTPVIDRGVPLQYPVMAAAAAFCTRTAQILQELVWSSNFWSFAMDMLRHQLGQNEAESAGSAGQVDATGVPTTLRLPSARDVETRARTVATSSGPQSKKNTQLPRHSSAGKSLIEEVIRLRHALQAHHGLAHAFATNCLLFLQMLDVVHERCQEALEARETESDSTGNGSKSSNLKRRVEELEASIEDLDEEIAHYQKSIEELNFLEKQSGQPELTNFQKRRREEAQRKVGAAEKRLQERHRTAAELEEEASALEEQQRDVEARLEHFSGQKQALEKAQDRSYLILGYFNTSVHLYAQMSDRLKIMD